MEIVGICTIPAVMRTKELIDEGKSGQILSFDAAHFYSSVISVYFGTQYRPNFTDADYVQDIMEAAYRSAEQDSWVNV